MILDLDQLNEFILKIRDKNIIALDCETDSLDPVSANLVGISIAYDLGHSCYIPLRHGSNLNNVDLLFKENTELTKQIEFKDALCVLKYIFEDKSIFKSWT